MKTFRKFKTGILLAAFFLALPGFTAVGEAAEYTINPKNSEIGFNLDSTLHMVHGKAKQFSGTLRVPADLKPEGFSVELAVSVKEMDTDHEKRDKKMHNVCFVVEEFPEVRFKSTKFTGIPELPASGEKFQFTLEGDLTIKDVTKNVSIPVEVTSKGNGTLFSGKVWLNYIKDFKIKDPSVFIFRVAKKVEVFFEVEAPNLVLVTKTAAASGSTTSSGEEN